MPRFEKLSKSEVRRIQSPGGRPELAEYVAFLKRLAPGEWARVVKAPRESVRAVKRRLGAASRLLGKRLRYHEAGKKTELLFSVDRAGPVRRRRRRRVVARRVRRRVTAKAVERPTPRKRVPRPAPPPVKAPGQGGQAAG
jgi:hypothetical protein